MRIAHLDGDPYVHVPLPTKEPLCAVCEQPIMWHLDMFSMLNMADRRLVHARCVWTQEAFLREAHRASTHPDVGRIEAVE